MLTRIGLALFLVFALLGPAFAQAQVPGTATGQRQPSPAAANGPASPQLSSQEAARALIEVLNNEAARVQLVDELKKIAAPADPPAAPEASPKAFTMGATPPTTPPPEGGQDTSLAHDLGVYTQSLLEDAVLFFGRIWQGLSNLAGLINGKATINWERLNEQVSSLGMLVLVALFVLSLLRWISRWPRRMLAANSENRHFAFRLLMIAGSIAIELACLAGAWLAAIIYLIYSVGAARIGLLETLFMNAFLGIETVKIGLRLIFMPQHKSLRLLPMSDSTARYWNFWLARLVGFVGYGVLLLFPMVNMAVSFAVGLGFRMAVVLIALVTTITLILRNRLKVREGLIFAAMEMRPGALSATIAMFARMWHFLAIAYVLVAFGVWITRPLEAISFMMSATLLTLLAIVIGGSIMGMINRAILGGVRLPAEVKHALPLLENRLNLLVPTLLHIVRVLMTIAVAAIVLQAWDIIDMKSWIETERGADLLRRVIAAFIIVLVALAIWIAATSWLEFRMNPARGRVSTARARTLLTLFRNAFTIVLCVIASMLTLSELGIDIAPLIAGAGVLGLAVGFGSQKLVQDIITGAFIQFENAMNEGDVVTVAGISGVVEHLTIRSVGLRDASGVYHVIPFSSVDSVSNSMRGFAFHLANMNVNYRENISEVKRLMEVAFQDLMKTEQADYILEPLEMYGITAFTPNAVTVSARIKTLPGKQWSVGRAYNEILKDIFDQHHISIPLPQASIVIGDGREITALQEEDVEVPKEKKETSRD